MTMSTALNAQPLVDPFYHMPDAEQQHSHLLHHGPQQHQHSQPHQHTMAPQSGSPTSYFGYAAAPPLTQARQPQQAQQTPLQSLQQSQQPQQQPSQIAPSNSLFSSMFDLSSALPGPNSHNNSPPQMTSKNLTSPNMLANGNSSSGMFDQHVSHQEAVVYIRNLPMDLTHREFRLMFLFAREFLNCELLKSQTETEGYAYFKSPMAAASAQAVLQNMPVFSSNQPLKCEVKYINRADSQQQPSSSASSRFASKSRFNFPSSVTSPLEMPPSIDYYTEPSNHFSPTSPRSSYSIESAAVAVANNVGKSMLLDEEDDSSIKDIVKDPVAWFSRTSSTSSTTSNQFEKTKRSSSSASTGSSTFANVANGTSSVPLSVSSAIGANVAASGLPPIGSNNNAKSAASAIRRPSGGSGMTSNIATSRQYAVVAGGPSSATSETSSASSTVVGSPPSNSPQQKSYSPPQKTLQAASGNTGSNGSVGSAGQNNSVGSVPAGNRIMPPANPADQNPPCNTLYVGNLPPDTSEEELKNVFSSRPGYKRLCFRTKANGPMCFVEFDDVSYATRALDELYGYALSNSVKGGIRLSFSKNPLGVRNNNKQQSSSSSQSQSNGGNSSVGYRYGNDYEYSRN